MEGVQILAFGKSVMESLTAIRQDKRKGGNFTHPETGRDIIITRKGTGQFDTEYIVSPDVSSSPLHVDPGQADEWLEFAYDLDPFLTVLDDEAIRAKVRGEEAEPEPQRAASKAQIGGRVAAVLEAHIRAGGDRFRGIRHITAWDADSSILNPAYSPPKGLLADKTFREGFAALGKLGLSFDAWLYHPQIDELTDLARAFPDTRIVLDHVGGPLAIGPYTGKRDDIFPVWEKSIKALAGCPNVFIKVGGMGMRINGYGFENQAYPPSSVTLAAAWKPYVETCIQAFGASRCMFESNFPVDKGSYSYPVFWNACKLLANRASASERADLFAGTARRFYRLVD